MSKYIDADKLKAEIERRLERYDPQYTNAGSELKELISFIDSLQEQPEVDLEKEIICYQREDMDRDTTVRDVARHFYELGQIDAANKFDEIEYNRLREEAQENNERKEE